MGRALYPFLGHGVVGGAGGASLPLGQACSAPTWQHRAQRAEKRAQFSPYQILQDDYRSRKKSIFCCFFGSRGLFSKCAEPWLDCSPSAPAMLLGCPAQPATSPSPGTQTHTHSCTRAKNRGLIWESQARCRLPPRRKCSHFQSTKPLAEDPYTQLRWDTRLKSGMGEDGR